MTNKLNRNAQELLNQFTRSLVKTPNIKPNPIDLVKSENNLFELMNKLRASQYETLKQHSLDMVFDTITITEEAIGFTFRCADMSWLYIPIGYFIEVNEVASNDIYDLVSDSSDNIVTFPTGVLDDGRLAYTTLIRYKEKD